MKFYDDKEVKVTERDPAKLIGHLFVMPNEQYEGKTFDPLMLIQYDKFKYRLIDLRGGNRYEDYDVTSIPNDWIDVTDSYYIARI